MLDVRSGATTHCTVAKHEKDGREKAWRRKVDTSVELSILTGMARRQLTADEHWSPEGPIS